MSQKTAYLLALALVAAVCWLLGIRTSATLSGFDAGFICGLSLAVVLSGGLDLVDKLPDYRLRRRDPEA